MKEGNKKTTDPKPKSQKHTDKLLIENFISLQKIMVDFSEKFEKLSKQISELLNLFEESAKTLVKKDFEVQKDQTERDVYHKEVLLRMDRLMDQNKIIAKGLTLLHENQKSEETREFPAPRFQNQTPSIIQNKRDFSMSFKKPIVKEANEEIGPNFEIPQ